MSVIQVKEHYLSEKPPLAKYNTSEDEPVIIQQDPEKEALLLEHFKPGNEPHITHTAVDRSFAEPMQKISVIMCGAGGTGKSCLTMRFCKSRWRDGYDPTIEDAYTITRNVEGIDYTISIIDTAGQEEYRAMWDFANRICDAFIMVYDITDQDSLDQLEQLNTSIDNMYNRRAADFKDMDDYGVETEPILRPVKIVVGNKCDLQENRIVRAQDGLRWARAHGCAFMETSARAPVNVNETLNLCIKRVAEMRSTLGPRFKGPSQMLPNPRLLTPLPTPSPPNVHAPTAPLSPLQPPSSQGEDDAEGKGYIKGRYFSFFKKLKCWS